jgi:hypothetical protein
MPAPLPSEVHLWLSRVDLCSWDAPFQGSALGAAAAATPQGADGKPASQKSGAANIFLADSARAWGGTAGAAPGTGAAVELKYTPLKDVLSCEQLKGGWPGWAVAGWAPGWHVRCSLLCARRSGCAGSWPMLDPQARWGPGCRRCPMQPRPSQPITRPPGCAGQSTAA